MNKQPRFRSPDVLALMLIVVSMLAIQELKFPREMAGFGPAPVNRASLIAERVGSRLANRIERVQQRFESRVDQVECRVERLIVR